MVSGYTCSMGEGELGSKGAEKNSERQRRAGLILFA